MWFSCAVQVITMAPPSFPFRWLEPRSCRVEEQKSYQKMAQKKMTLRLRDVDSRVTMLTRFVNSMWILVFWKTWLCWLFFDQRFRFDACGNARGSPKLEGADLHSAASARKGGKVIGKVQLFSGLARSMANCRIVLFLLLNTFGNIPTMWDVLQIPLWILYVCDIM